MTARKRKGQEAAVKIYGRAGRIYGRADLEYVRIYVRNDRFEVYAGLK